MSKIKSFIAVFIFSLVFFAPAVTIVSAPTTQALTTDDCEATLLGMPPWFRGLSKVEKDSSGEERCAIKAPTELNTASQGEPSNGLQNFIWRIALNVIEIGLFIAGFIAVGFVLYGGFLFLTGGSNPGQVEKGRKSILNAVIGLAISMAAIAVTKLIFGIING
jgi:hypothetical protein